MLLYLTKYSRPDLCNDVRELAMCMDKATKGTYLEMLRVIKFVIDTKNFCLRIKPEFKGKIWSLRVFCDSDWAGNSETRISVTGFILYLMNVPVGVLRPKRELLFQVLKQNMWLCQMQSKKSNSYTTYSEILESTLNYRF
jgi:hypothetical protein